jgi:glycine cleavage system H protein
MTDNQATYPENLKYTREHEWVRLEGDVSVVGITYYAQSELGDVVFVDLPAKGKALVAGEELGTIESVKAVSEIYAPVSGEVLETNEGLRDHPDRVNADPYGQGWLVKVRVGNPKDLDDLLTASAYRTHVEEGGN